jgi:hypothetical protein
MKLPTLKQLRALEEALQDALNAKIPADEVPDSIAIPLLNRLEARGEAITEAFDLLLNEIGTLLAS